MKFKCLNTIKLNRFKLSHFKMNRSDKERGSSSVLVIMIMLLLITFGVLAMMSSYSNLKMSKKNAQWTQMFYVLESQAKESTQEFDQIYDEAIAFVSQLQSQSAVEMDKAALDKTFILKIYELCGLNEKLSSQIENCNFKSESEIKLDQTEYMPTIQLITQDMTTNRKFLCEIQIDLQSAYLTERGYSVTAWCEIPQNFEYDEQLNFEDPEGN